MIARFFHNWERRLHAVSKDRVVRPFEWGLDWIDPTPHRQDASPERLLLDWASHAVADSPRFFETPETSDYMFRRNVDGATGALSFPSALHTRYPEYLWDHNKGYGTEEHRAALARVGPSPHHRTSFLGAGRERSREA